MKPNTRKAIKESFMLLLNQKPLSKITVKEIVANCGINRNSFYYHFSDIPTLLTSMSVSVSRLSANSASPSANAAWV